MTMFRPDFGSLADMMRRNATYFGALPAIVMGKRTVNFAQLLERARSLAGGFAAAGLKPGDRIAVLSHNSIEILEIYAAAELAGYVVVPLNYRLAPREIRSILSDAEPQILFHEPRFAGALDTICRDIDGFCAIEIGEAYEAFIAATPAHWAEPAVASSDIAHLLYTSGTTGKPKGCLQSHRASAFAAANISSVMQGGCEDRGLLVMPVCHAGGKRFQMAIHWQAGALHMLPAFDAQQVLATIAEQGITILHLAPTMIQMLLDHPDINRYDTSSVKTVLYGAAPMPLPLLRRGLDRFGDVFVQMYGQTEGDGLVLAKSFHEADGSARSNLRLTSIGHPTPGVRLRIVDDDGHDVLDGEAGEMLLSTPTVMQGYWRDEAATAKALAGGWLHTGDVVRRDPDGFIYLIDRKKDLIISGGLNISSREVEDALSDHPDVQEAAAIGIPDEKWGEAVVGVVVMRKGATLDVAALTAHCRERIAGYKVPKRIVGVAELPRLATGKVNKVGLRAMQVIA